MKMLLIALVVMTTCFSCHKKTAKECSQDYKEERTECGAAAIKCTKDAKMAKVKCKAIKDPIQRDKCLKDADAALKNCDDSEGKCVRKAKKYRDKCRESARSSK
jgi:hypothetical protein